MEGPSFQGVTLVGVAVQTSENEVDTDIYEAYENPDTKSESPQISELNHWIAKPKKEHKIGRRE